jgi:N-acetylglucosaminyldiphosphoundecaprenol N-acetyl-beta-D-mannosaminyltransferase
MQRSGVAAGVQAVPPVVLLGVPVDAVTLDQAAEHVVRSAKAGTGGWVITPNLDILRRTVRDAEFRRMYDLATLRLADGMPLVWASKLKRTPLPERAAGSDLIFALAAKAAAQGASIFLLGGNPGAAEKCAAVLCEKHEGLRIAGIECPSPGFERDSVQMERLLARVREASPDIVFVALGSPKQEKLIEILRQHLPRAWFLGIGITFSFVAGEVKRAPMWMRKSGLEWLHRMLQEPRRLVKRYLIDGLPFAMRLIAVSAFEGLRGKRPESATPA